MGDNGSRRVRHVFLSVLMFCSASSAWTGAWAGTGTTSPDPTPTGSPPTAPTFTGAMELVRPCKFTIGMSATDPDYDLNTFVRSGGTVPNGYAITGSTLTGPSTCIDSQWRSEWKAKDQNDNLSPPNTLTLTCRPGSNNSPSKPTYSGQRDQTPPCSFNIGVSSTDPEGDRVEIEIVDDSCLPPNHSLSGGDRYIVGGPTNTTGSWTCKFTASDEHCGSSDSSVTMTCSDPAPVLLPCCEYGSILQNGAQCRQCTNDIN